MFARNVSFRLKSNTHSDYTRTLENDVLPLLRKQKGFKDELAAKYPDLKLVAEKVADGKAAGAATTMANLIAASPNLRGVFASNLATAEGAGQAIADSKKADAIKDYQSLLADSAPDARWRSMVNAHLAALTGAPAPATDAAAIPEAQRPMIEGMVSKLATRLASNGGGLDEWSRLIRAYAVLHEADKAKAALVDAHKALASDAGAVASLDALARDLGLGDAN